MNELKMRFSKEGTCVVLPARFLQSTGLKTGSKYERNTFS